MKDKQEKKDQEQFNSVTKKTKPENQNQHLPLKIEQLLILVILHLMLKEE